MFSFSPESPILLAAENVPERSSRYCDIDVDVEDGYHHGKNDLQFFEDHRDDGDYDQLIKN
ncbi:hypothetical protein DCAR_0832760 [Daucus carota subsp. sativus]|uniref:Uncharacterized protein n=1 Tax=Daucus carota subsp. sativus TaxID=79200 RepID=A0A175YRG7_DAUCS|nr:hypothetical protein DCAR_0832760 [Daucus carota subsp. sativus]